MDAEEQEGTYSPNWTVMVYLAGNNDLDEDMVTSLEGLCKRRANRKSNIFAYYASANPLRPVSLYDFTEDKGTDDIEAYRVEDPSKFCDCSLGSSADPETLVDFVKCCRKHSHTHHNVLVLSGHSDAFIGRSLLKDETALRVMTFIQLRDALQEIRRVLGQKLDILGFDSCAMSMIENAYELRDTAQILVSPQDFTPTGGWDYFKMLSTLADPKTSDNPEDHAENFVKQYIKFETNFSVAARSVDISATRLGRLERLVGMLAKLADFLRADLPRVKNPHTGEDFGDDAYAARYEDKDIGGLMYSQMIDLILSSHWFSQTQLQDQSVDVFDFCRNLALECAQLKVNLNTLQATSGEAGKVLMKRLEEIICVCMQVRDERNAIVIKSCYAGNELQFSLGLSLFFPWSRLGFLLGYDSYRKLAFVEGEGYRWLSLINRFTNETTIHRIPKPVREREHSFDSLYLRIGRYDPPGKGALARFREKFGRVKNYPLSWCPSECVDKREGEKCEPLSIKFQ